MGYSFLHVHNYTCIDIRLMVTRLKSFIQIHQLMSYTSEKVYHRTTFIYMNTYIIHVSVWECFRVMPITDFWTFLRVKLIIPAFTKNKPQLSAEDVTLTRRIARVRIHVERAIRRLKVFKILSGTVPVAYISKDGIKH
jgi:hypothetical protein